MFSSVIKKKKTQSKSKPRPKLPALKNEENLATDGDSTEIQKVETDSNQSASLPLLEEAEVVKLKEISTIPPTVEPTDNSSITEANDHFEKPIGTYEEIVNAQIKKNASLAPKKSLGTIVNLPTNRGEDTNNSVKLKELFKKNLADTYDIMKDIVSEGLILNDALNKKLPIKLKTKNRLGENKNSSTIPPLKRRNKLKQNYPNPREEIGSSYPLNSDLDEIGLMEDELIQTSVGGTDNEKKARRMRRTRDRQIAARVAAYQGDKPIDIHNLPLSVLCLKTFSSGVNLPGHTSPEHSSPHTSRRKISQNAPALPPAPVNIQDDGIRLIEIDGKLVFNQSTFVHEDEEARREAMEAELEVVQTDDLNRHTNFGTYSIRTAGQGKRWNKEQTELFYTGIEKFGMEFEVIANKLFKGPNSTIRTARQIKQKYICEDKKNSGRIDAALKKNRLNYAAQGPAAIRPYDLPTEQSTKLETSTSATLENMQTGTSPQPTQTNQPLTLIPKSPAKLSVAELDQTEQVVEEAEHDKVSPHLIDEEAEIFEVDAQEFSNNLGDISVSEDYDEDFGEEDYEDELGWEE